MNGRRGARSGIGNAALAPLPDRSVRSGAGTRDRTPQLFTMLCYRQTFFQARSFPTRRERSFLGLARSVPDAPKMSHTADLQGAVPLPDATRVIARKILGKGIGVRGRKSFELR
jgi:hypothetical protein